jgi:hypothetical protein
VEFLVKAASSKKRSITAKLPLKKSKSDQNALNLVASPSAKYQLL